MHPWEIHNGNDDKYNCFNNTNYNDNALKKCRHLKNFGNLFSLCNICCNHYICEQYAERPEIKIDSNMEYEIQSHNGAPIYITSGATLFNELWF